MTILLLLLLLQSKAPDAEQLVGAPQGAPLSGPRLEERALQVAALLRCPVCQGLSVADSPSEMAVNMKHQVRELLARGYTEEQILRYFEMSYGQFVLLRPRFQGVNTLVWVLPVGALLIGVMIVMMKMKKLTQAPSPRESGERDGVRGESIETEDPYLAQVRDLVGGKK